MFITHSCSSLLPAELLQLVSQPLPIAGSMVSSPNGTVPASQVFAGLWVLCCFLYFPLTLAFFPFACVCACVCMHVCGYFCVVMIARCVYVYAYMCRIDVCCVLLCEVVEVQDEVNFLLEKLCSLCCLEAP